MPYVRRGDIVGTRGDGFLAKAILWATRTSNESPSLIQHVELIVNDAPLSAARIVGALHKVRYSRLDDAYGHKNTQIGIWRATNLTEPQKNAIVDEALKRVGNRYPYWRLIFQLIDHRIFGGAMVFRKMGMLKRWNLCSGLVSECYAAVGLNFGVEKPSPDDIQDFIDAHPEIYQCVRPLAPLRDRG